MKRAYGSGSIFKMKGKNRRKPWRVGILLDRIFVWYYNVNIINLRDRIVYFVG